MAGDGMARHPGRSKIGWGFFGKELKRSREAAGLTQQELGERVYCSGSYIGQFEAATRKPQLDLALRFDAELDTDGFLARMCKELINNSPFADYFADAAELERFALTITEYAPQLIPLYGGPFTGHLLDDPALFAKCRLSYDLLRAAALPCDASLSLIESAAEEYGGK